MRYLNRIDESRLKQIENNQRKFIQYINKQYLETKEQLEQQFNDTQNEIEGTNCLIDNLTSVTTLMQNFICDGK